MVSTTIPQSIAARANEKGYEILAHEHTVKNGLDFVRRLTVLKGSNHLSLQAVIKDDPDVRGYIGGVMNEDDYEDDTFNDLCSIGFSSESALVSLINELP